MSRTPEETFRRLLDLLLAKDMDAVADLWAPDGTADFPFAEGASARHLTGREAVREYLAAYPTILDVQEVDHLSVYRSDRPDTIVVEFGARGRIVATGEPYRLDYVTVITTRDGLITGFRDHWSPVAVARAFGRMPALVAALSDEEAAR